MRKFYNTAIFILLFFLPFNIIGQTIIEKTVFDYNNKKKIFSKTVIEIFDKNNNIIEKIDFKNGYRWGGDVGVDLLLENHIYHKYRKLKDSTFTYTKTDSSLWNLDKIDIDKPDTLRKIDYFADKIFTDSLFIKKHGRIESVWTKGLEDRDYLKSVEYLYKDNNLFTEIHSYFYRRNYADNSYFVSKIKYEHKIVQENGFNKEIIIRSDSSLSSNKWQYFITTEITSALNNSKKLIQEKDTLGTSTDYLYKNNKLVQINKYQNDNLTRVMTIRRLSKFNYKKAKLLAKKLFEEYKK